VAGGVAGNNLLLDERSREELFEQINRIDIEGQGLHCEELRTVLYYILLIMLLTAISLVGLLLMIKKYYWGPSGHPPRYRRHNGKLRE
jgi:hypothetical protein